MIEIICASIAAAATVICALVGGMVGRMNRQTEARAEQRAKEGRLQLKLIAANNKLTVGVATALKNGYANGEVEEGLRDVNAAQLEYRRFLEETAIGQIRE